MGKRKRWKVDLLSGRSAATAALCILFLLGSVAGCITAGAVDARNGDVLLADIAASVTTLGQDRTPVRFLSVLWQTVRAPLAAFVLGFTALGVAGLPLLFLARGFLLCYAVSVFYRFLGLGGLLAAFLLFAATALFWLPALLRLGTQSLVSACALLRRVMGEARCPTRLDGAYFAHAGICALLLAACAAVEYLCIPLILQVVSGVLPGG